MVIWSGERRTSCGAFKGEKKKKGEEGTVRRNRVEGGSRARGRASERASAGGASSRTGVKKLRVTAESDVEPPVTVPAGGFSAEPGVEHKRDINAQAETRTTE